MIRTFGQFNLSKNQFSKLNHSSISSDKSGIDKNPIKEINSTIGNRLLTSSLRISSTDDSLEKQADRISESILNTGSIGPLGENGVVQKMPGGNMSGTRQNKQLGGLGRGRGLGTSAREFFEVKFNRDFSSVKIHDDERSGELASSINARAFTYGNNIVFNRDEYNPNSAEGRKLLAHELTHVVQQNGATGNILNRQEQDDSTKTNIPTPNYNVTGDFVDVLLVPVDGGKSYKAIFQINVSLELNLIEDFDVSDIRYAVEQALLESTVPIEQYVINGVPVEVFWDLKWVDKSAVNKGESLGINIVTLQLIADLKGNAGGFFSREGKAFRIYIPRARTKCYISGDCADFYIERGRISIVHEIGHSLALSHTPDMNSIMHKYGPTADFTSEDIRKMIVNVISAHSSDPDLIPVWLRE